MPCYQTGLDSILKKVLREKGRPDFWIPRFPKASGYWGNQKLSRKYPQLLRNVSE